MAHHNFILGLLEILAVASCSYGLFVVGSSGKLPPIGIICGAVWFVFGLLSNICGLVALGYVGSETTTDDDPAVEKFQMWVQYHYLLAWMTIVIGYPTFLLQLWMAETENPLIYGHLLIAVLPICVWLSRNTHLIVRVTQVSAAICIFSHFYLISSTNNNPLGYVAAVFMMVNVTLLSVPTRYNIWGFTTREGYAVGLSIVSFLFALEHQ